MILIHNCKECGFKGEVITKDRKVQCPKCKTINDFWLKGENPPSNHK